MNFSTSDVWNKSLILRYPKDQIIKIGNLLFYKQENIYKCQHFFDFEISDNEILQIQELIDKGYKIKFNYMNDTMIKKFKNLNNCNIEFIDSWDAPILILDETPKNYFLKNDHSQIKRNYSNYVKYKENFKFYNSSNEDILKLWNYVLTIDFNSWKKEEKSDMKSLDREDLQYLPFLLTNKNDSNLVVICNLNDQPLAYSLMFKGSDKYWYAVKWGASNIGRKQYVGFYALFNHIEYLYNINKNLKLDFWGRRSSTYDKIKNNIVKRSHIVLFKGDKENENNIR